MGMVCAARSVATRAVVFLRFQQHGVSIALDRRSTDDYGGHDFDSAGRLDGGFHDLAGYLDHNVDFLHVDDLDIIDDDDLSGGPGRRDARDRSIRAGPQHHGLPLG